MKEMTFFVVEVTSEHSQSVKICHFDSLDSNFEVL